MRLVVSIMIAALLLAGCARSSDEEQIARAITAIAEAVEGKKFIAIQAHLHDSFRANEQMDARQVQQLLAMHGLRHERLGVTIAASKTTLDPIYPDRATTVLSVVLTGSSGRLPSDGRIRTVELEWIKIAGDWLVIKAKWQP